MVRSGFVLSLLASAGGFLSSEAKKIPQAKQVAGSYVVEFEDSQVYISLQPYFLLCCSDCVWFKGCIRLLQSHWLEGRNAQ